MVVEQLELFVTLCSKSERLFFPQKNVYLTALGLSCATLGIHCSMWDLFPRPGIKPGPLALEAWSLSHWITREIPRKILIVMSD